MHLFCCFEVVRLNLRTAFLVIAVAFAIYPLHAGAVQERAVTVNDRERINLTVYNGGTALVHDRRRVGLNSGINRIAWRDVSAKIDPTSALLESIDLSSPIEVLEQNFNFDLLDPSALLHAKDDDQNVDVVESIPGDWQILQTTLPYVKSFSPTATWGVRVPRDGRAVLAYTARTTWCGQS